MPDNMRQTLEVENIVMDALLDYGYPRNSIVMEGKLDARRFVDFVVTDLDTGLPMMIIEVKSGGERTLDSVKQMALDSGYFDEVVCFSRISSQFLKVKEIEKKEIKRKR